MHKLFSRHPYSCRMDVRQKIDMVISLLCVYLPKPSVISVLEKTQQKKSNNQPPTFPDTSNLNTLAVISELIFFSNYNILSLEFLCFSMISVLVFHGHNFSERFPMLFLIRKQNQDSIFTLLFFQFFWHKIFSWNTVIFQVLRSLLSAFIPTSLILLLPNTDMFQEFLTIGLR